ncbi:MAG TPA: phospho-sugar mutase [Jiangellaceae bacterium]|jgi:phosphomannomutase|nr:phospho-sugar mutase [Jiangellaceae bacterium]
MTEVLDKARAWLAEDPDPDTRPELTELIERAESADEAAIADLEDRFSGKLEFGTAGLRGTLGAGSNRMNRAVVIRAAAGLAAYLHAHGGSSVVVGYDARHKSDQFARDTCAVMIGAGLRAMVLPRPLPTPVLAFAIRHLGVDAGVMVTASHNPSQDNGYKVYLGDGSQIVPPTDTEISAAIDAVGALESVPLADSGWQTLDEAVLDAYVARVAAVARPDGPRDVAIVYTPLHGVGGEVMGRVFEATGFPRPVAVEQQADPDPDFPTVAFPNPEEPGAIDLALDLAARNDADLVIANDPDADRCAVAAPTPGGWRMLRGDEVGALLATYLIAREPGLSGVFACSIVSSSLLGKIAGRHGLGYAETLTGFKWIGRIDGLRFGYEEALGYCVDPDAVRDKDGLSAAVLIAELAATLRAEGRGISDALDDIARGYGLHATDQLPVRVADLGQIDTVMERLRTMPPSTLGGRAVEQVDDLALGIGGLPPTEGVRYWLADNARVIVRPSGTEPKIKCYLEVVIEAADGDVDAARALATGHLEAIKADLGAAAGL